ncbi:hypothetical protein RJ639_003843 [Escallonia herrerae]|uniref:Protein NEOXANTHIN-DEFICIENT 1 n=1 Tax=Escallonia herrerae TaxID=1293975 RepID=A0AA88W2J7_9ASTE|nr:hypothetical protein RJ639_003843 [Escallonia herrerae]
MEVEERKTPSGYGKLPWVFKGRQVTLYCGTNLCALYQLHLLKAETARVFIPKEFRLVEAFGYTLGGFFLASYDDSPAGTFDEVLVLIAGTVWNPPTSCAWAARVLVSSEEACIHGRKVDVGLPSQVASFSKDKWFLFKQRITPTRRPQKGKIDGFLSMMGVDTASHRPKNGMDIQVCEVNGSAAADICNINLAAAGKRVPEQNSNQGMGPIIKMSLPNFSGRTEYNQHLLKYSCQITCRVRPVSPAKVFGPSAPVEDSEQSCESRSLNSKDSTSGKPGDNKRNLSIAVMLSKPILALEFNSLKMQVHPPVVVSQITHNPLED